MTVPEPKDALLHRRVAEYLAEMEAPAKRVDYTRVSTDRLLLIEALHDWSGRLFGEGGEIYLTHGCDDPCCATAEERTQITRLLHANDGVIIYPISAFSLSDKHELKFNQAQSAFRMLAHSDGSCASAVGIAEASRVKDIQAAARLWTMSAVEDCMAYLAYQLERHGLCLESPEERAARGILTSALQGRFAAGQVYNAIWRTAKDAAAYSTRQYASRAKAAEYVPRRLDQVLAKAAAALASFPHYGRVTPVPMGAVLTLFQQRFGIGHETSGHQVMDILTADAPDFEPDDQSDSSRSAVVGTFHFLDTFSPLDQLVVAHFKATWLSSPTPQWEEASGGYGHIGFTLAGLYDFDGQAFVQDLLPLLEVDSPSAADLLRHAEQALIDKDAGEEYVDTSGRTQALDEALEKAGYSVGLRSGIANLARFPVEPSEVLQRVRQLPLPSGLVAIRSDHAYIYGDCVEQSSCLRVDDLQISIPESVFHPEGNDRSIVTAVARQDEDGMTDLLGTGVTRLIYCDDAAKRAQVFRALSRKLAEAADRLDGQNALPPEDRQ